MAFFGGMFAGLLRLDASDEPLKEWIDRTAAAAGVRHNYVTCLAHRRCTLALPNLFEHRVTPS